MIYYPIEPTLFMGRFIVIWIRTTDYGKIILRDKKTPKGEIFVLPG